MKQCLIVLIFYMAVVTSKLVTQVINLVEDYRDIHLIHVNSEDPVESRWNINCDNCVIILHCKLSSASCSKQSLTFSYGNHTKKYCGGTSPWTLSEGAISQINITIMTYGRYKSSRCSVTRVPPYVNIPYEEHAIDSEEHGYGIGATRIPSCSCGRANKDLKRIIGGEETVPNEYPFAVLLKGKEDMRYSCGGSIITPYHILTAAHCADSDNIADYVSLVIGEHDIRKADESNFTKEIEIDQVIIHPDFDETYLNNDLSIIIPKEKIDFNKGIGPICLPNARYNVIDSYVKVMGWGYVKEGTWSPILMDVNLKVIDISICKKAFPNSVGEHTTICTWAPNRDSCQMDSGGPVVWVDPDTMRYTLIGMISGGGECAKILPGINTDIYSYLDWIKKTIAETKPSEVCI